MTIKFKFLNILWLILITASLSQVAAVHNAYAWGKRGHQISGEVAALVLSDLSVEGHKSTFLVEHSYDFGFYNNVPDLVWKHPDTYAKEAHNHFMDMEIFERKIKPHGISLKEAFALGRKEFEKKFPDIETKEGRAFWRVKEFVSNLEAVTEKLRQSTQEIAKKRKAKESIDSLVKKHRQLQERWLVYAGVVGHYVSDMAQPLHATENYDGQLTDQKGIHSVYETDYVNALYPQIMVDVFKQAKKQWPKFNKENKDLPLLDLLLKEVEQSGKDLKVILDLDRRLGRKDLAKNAPKFKSILEKNLVLGSLTLAQIYHRNLGWEFFGEKFYFIDTKPKFISPDHKE